MMIFYKPNKFYYAKKLGDNSVKVTYISNPTAFASKFLKMNAIQNSFFRTVIPDDSSFVWKDEKGIIIDNHTIIMELESYAHAYINQKKD